MARRSIRYLQAVLVALAMAGSVEVLSGKDKPGVKLVPPSRTSMADGKEMFRAYCAVCHGPQGKGNGPAEQALKMPPADLTILARENGGKFPELRVYGVIQGDSEMAAHGSREMPVWGSVFRDISRGSGAEVNLRLRNLTKYVESMQVK